MDIQQAKQESKQNEEWAACDPFTLVSAAKQTLYSEVGPQHKSQGGSGTLKPLEEIISRFEQQTRASLGSRVVSQGGVGQ